MSNVYDEFEEMQQESGANSATEFIEMILENQHRPQKINEENIRKLEENRKFIEELQTKNASCENNYAEYDRQISEKDQQIAQFQSRIEHLEENLQETISAGKLPVNGHIIQLDPLNVLLLQYVAEREGEKRKQEWTMDDVINYFIYNRFERGDINGNIDSVPDHVVRKFKKQLENAE